MSYTEVFVMGDVSSGSYRCLFTLSDPDGWSWHPGGPPHETAIRLTQWDRGKLVPKQPQSRFAQWLLLSLRIGAGPQ